MVHQHVIWSGYNLYPLLQHIPVYKVTLINNHYLESDFTYIAYIKSRVPFNYLFGALYNIGNGPYYTLSSTT